MGKKKEKKSGKDTDIAAERQLQLFGHIWPIKMTITNLFIAVKGRRPAAGFAGSSAIIHGRGSADVRCFCHFWTFSQVKSGDLEL